MAQANPFDQFDQRASAPTPGPVYGAPPKLDKPDAPKTTYRPLSPEEVQQRGLPVGNYQVSSEGNVSKVGGDIGGTVDEKKVATLTSRIAGAFSDINSISKVDPSAQEPGIIETVRGGLSPVGLMSIPVRKIAGANRRTVYDAQIDALDALLTLGTGAAYNREQLEGQLGSYFPAYDDTPEEIAIKNQRLQRQIAAAKANAGVAWTNVEPLISQYLQGVPAVPEADEQPQEEPGLIGPGADKPPPPGEVLIGYGMNKDGSPYPIYGQPGTTPPEGSAPPSGGNGGGGSFWQGIGAGVGDLVEGGVNNTVGLIVNPLNTVAGRAMGYEGFTSDIGQTIRDALDLPEGNQTVSAINQAASGGFGAAGLARRAGQVVGGATGQGLRTFGNNPLLDAATGATAAASGEGARQAGAGPGGQALATLAGGFTPAGVMAGRNAVRSVTGRTPPRGPAPDMVVVEAGQRQGVPIRQPDARPEMRGEFANLQTGQYAGPSINQARQADNAMIEQRVDEIGGGGNPSDPYALGTRVQAAGQRYIAKTKAQANRLYDRVRETSGGATVTARNADAALDANIKELRAAGENSNAAAINYLEGLRGDVDRGLTVEAVQNLRTNMRGQLKGQGLTGTDTERRVMQVIDAMNIDLAEQLPAEASQALRAADAFYRQRQEFINGTLSQFLGNKGKPLPAETAAQRLVSMAQGKGNFERFGNMWKELDDAERADVAATIAASLGRKANGDFSPATLIRSLDPVKGVNPRTARLVFGEEGAKALNDLRLIAQAKTDTANALNSSKTGVMVNRASGGLRSLILGGLGLSGGGLAGGVMLPAAGNLLSKISEERAARLMLNPDFTQWLRAMPQATNPKAINAYFGKLKASAVKSQVFANDVEAFTGAVLDSFAQSPRRAAAQQEND
jgi:hypothetical protein